MNHVQIYVVKEQRESVLEKYPNLSSSVTVPIHEFDTEKDFSSATDSQIKKFSEKALKNKSYVNTKYEFEDREKVKVVQNYEIKEPVFEGKISIPDKVVEVSRQYNNVGRVEVSK